MHSLEHLRSTIKCLNVVHFFHQLFGSFRTLYNLHWSLPSPLSWPLMPNTKSTSSPVVRLFFRNSAFPLLDKFLPWQAYTNYNPTNFSLDKCSLHQMSLSAIEYGLSQMPTLFLAACKHCPKYCPVRKLFSGSTLFPENKTMLRINILTLGGFIQMKRVSLMNSVRFFPPHGQIVHNEART